MPANKAKAQPDTDHEASSKVSMPVTRVATKHHPEFYFDDSLVVLQVEDTLFRVHKYQLIKSDTFSDMFKMPKGPTQGIEEGASPERPIVLEGVKSSDFAALLKALYAVYFTNERPKCEPEVIVPAFRLAHMWNFSDLRDHLLPLVKDALGCVDKIVLGRELGIQEWLAPAHLELCQRTESLTMEEVRKLGIDSTVMVLRLREQSRPSQSALHSPECAWRYCRSCGLNSPVYTNHGNGDCRKCGRHIISGEQHYRFPATPLSTAPPSTVPNSGFIWTYCNNGCGGSSPIYGNHGPGDCHRCGTHISSSTSHFLFIAPSTAPPTAPPSSNPEIESQLKKWVEDGCVTE